MTTNNGPAVLFRNDQLAGNRSAALPPDRHQVEPRRHRRDGAHLPRRHVAVADGEERLELPVAVGAAGDLRRRTRDRVERVVIAWPSGRTEEFKNVATGKAYECVEGKGMLIR